MSALALVLREGPVAQLRRDETDQPADANVRHLVALDTSVDPGARDLQEVSCLACIPQAVPELFCCVHGAERVHVDRLSCQHMYDSYIAHVSFLERDVLLE